MFTVYGVQGVSFIVFFNTVAVSHRKRTSTGTLRDSCPADRHNKMYVMLF
jgi:hypothetical protein